MSIISALKHDLGIVEGILIPGASVSTVNLTHSVQQAIATNYGPAISGAITTLATNATLSGPEKSLAIANTVANDIITKGVKAEFKTLRDTVVDIVQAAYRAIEPSIGADIVALASAFHAGPVLTEVAELAGPLVQQAVDKLAPAPVAPAAA